jgi:uncharacterized protein YbjT (DUF2867 family)
MTVLVTGATGTVGADVVGHLAGEGVPVRALTRAPEKASFPDGVTPVRGELSDPAAMRIALDGAAGLFLLSPVSPDELTGTLATLQLARQAGVRDVAYLSVICAEQFTDPPHFAAKAAAERVIADFGIAATVLRPGYYMQNDAAQKDQILGGGVYPPPVGNNRVLAVDTRDLAEVAARCLLERRGAHHAPQAETLDVVSPEVLTADAIAGIWADVLGRLVSYAGDDLDEFETQMRGLVPGWLAYDLRLMFQRFQTDGMSAASGTDERLRELLGRPMRTYRDFAEETAATWR